ncbi:MAG: GGDEF domain-containing protein [Planctomycetota bacterium]|jgi:diguanylate cyclase (GGDEF)-like protein
MESTYNNKMFDVLVIGDINKAFVDSDVINQTTCQIHANVLDGLKNAAKSNYSTIAFIMAASCTDIVYVLKSLRQASPEARIILLAQMHEEPRAIQLIGATSNGEKIADDYLICPTYFNRLGTSVPLTSQIEKDKKNHPTVTPTKLLIQRPKTIEPKLMDKIEHLEKLATEDDLTGLKNRRYIFEFCRQIIQFAKEQGSSITLLVFDIDDFKHYNDLYGHTAGDEILKQAAKLMRRSCRNHDIVGRIGGDEFVVIFWDNQIAPDQKEPERRSTQSEHPKEALFIAKRFRAEFNKADLNMLGPSGQGSLTISGGLASYPRDADSAEILFQKADHALLEAKRNGKNRIYLVGQPENDIADI